ncbi:MAG: hypothetical protein JW738_06990 [Actinobacteria bacterium]|nr:hypothetical protein [Actinomycetota bacterium]
MEELRRLILEEEAQTTAEYALVIFGAALVAAGLLFFVGDGNVIKDFFANIFKKVTELLG